jgi:hypothetical protein
MSGRPQNVLLDTNAVIDLLKGAPGAEELYSSHLDGNSVYISQITRMELLAFPSLSESEEAQVKAFLESVEVVLLGDEIEGLAIKIRREKNLKLPDAIILASAQAFSCKIATRDERIAASCQSIGVTSVSWGDLPDK